MRQASGLAMCMLIVNVLAGAAWADAGWPTTRPGRVVLEDIRFLVDWGTLVFSNSKLSVSFKRATGNWAEFHRAGVDETVAGPERDSLDAVVDGQPVFKWLASTFTGYDVIADHARRQATLRLYFQWEVEGEGRAFQMSHQYTLESDSPVLRRRCMLVRLQHAPPTGNQPLRFQGFRLSVPFPAVGRPSDCRLHVPGPFWPNRWIRSGTAYDDFGKAAMSFHQAPDAGLGVVCLSNPKLNKTMASWVETEGKVAYRTTIKVNSLLEFHHETQAQQSLDVNQAIASDTHCIAVVDGGVDAALAEYRKSMTRKFPLPATRPAWVRDAVILEVYPKYFAEGFKGITKKLPFYKEVGFNVIYLMPHWKGGYSPIDQFAVEEAYGSEEDLKQLVVEAHRLGLKVLFDMVIHGMNEKSELPKQRPELFCRDEKGELARHPTWKSITFDWASPAYRKYMVTLALHDLEKYGIDGYRVDAQTFKGPTWDPKLPYPAYATGSASHEIIAEMLAAMRAKKPDVTMLSEVFGPLFYTCCDLVHDNQTEAPQYFLNLYAEGRASARDYREHIAEVYDALPEGALRVYFARNHDTSWFYKFGGYTPRFLALEAAHAFFGVPEVFAGDPKHGPSPDEDAAVWGYYRKLFAARAKFPEIARGRVAMREVEYRSTDVIAGLRIDGAKRVLCAVSLSDKATTVSLRIEGATGPVELMDPQSGATRTIKPNGGRYELELAPFQTMVGRVGGDQ